MILRGARLPDGPMPSFDRSIVQSNSFPCSLAANKLPCTEAKFLRVGGQRFWIKGVTYGSFRPNEAGEPFPPFLQLKDDFARMRDAGINTVRLYAPPSDRIADAAYDAGLHLIADICWGPRRCELDDPDRVRYIFAWTREHSRRLAGHPAMLLSSIGNEIPPLMVRWYGRQRIETFLRSLHETVKEEAPHALTTYAGHPPTEYLHLPFLDVVSYNVYLERETDFRAYLARLQSLAGERPLLLSEIGMDSSRNGEAAQAQAVEWQLRAVFEKGLCGATVYGWTDEWAIFGEEIEGWAFGLTDENRCPKPALETVRKLYTSSFYDLRERDWPRVSVVVASYNGGKTLDKCLASLGALDYPNYEIIVVDDGSTDATPQIVKRYPVKCIRVPNGGLSRARNLGIEAAEGEIVAFLDSDAYADPGWLYYLVTALEEADAAAVGGPNLSPPEDGFVAQCVDHAPGNPSHVLLDDTTAEHVPGCNMAFRKNALQLIGLFDPTHHAAGDDVDVCWKLLARDLTIAFHPGAFVWHHRRATVRAYLKQQQGYGYAEAHLQQRYPGRFNFAGHSVWQGCVYDSTHPRLRQAGLPILMQSRVYHGRFGSAQFQSLYQPFLTWWFQIFTTIEWQVLVVCILLSGLLAGKHPAGIGLLFVAGAMTAVTVVAAGLAAYHADKVKAWQNGNRWKGLLLVALLHVAQPVARAAGRLRGWWHTRAAEVKFSPVQRVWGNLERREIWLERLQKHLNACGWNCSPGGEWDASDIDVTGPGLCSAQIKSVYEDDVERGFHFVRFQVSVRRKPAALLLTALLVAALPAFVYAPYLLPLALPISILLRWTLRAKRQMQAAISQLAMECAEALDMPNAEGW